MDKNAQTMYATVIGAILILIGILGFFNDPLLGLFEVNPLHNVVHLISGAVLLWAGVWGGTKAAKGANITFGLAYALVAVLCFIAPGLLANMIDANVPDTWLHVALAVASLGVGFRAKA
jgi:hypothetical protein